MDTSWGSVSSGDASASKCAHLISRVNESVCVCALCVCVCVCVCARAFCLMCVHHKHVRVSVNVRGQCLGLFWGEGRLAR